MAWVESHQEIGGHPKTKKAAKRLGVNVPQMVGHLHLLWHWALAYADDGDLSRWDDDDVALGAQWDGDSGEFVRALADVGFIDEADESRWLHDWMDYAGRLVRERERKRAARSKPQDTDPPPDSTTSDDEPHTDDGESAERPQTGGGHDADSPPAGTNQPNQPTNQPVADADASSADGERDPIAEQFDDWWQRFPRGPAGKPGGDGSKKKAWQRWRRLTQAQRDACMVGVEHYREFVDRPDTPRTCMATTWLNEERWEQWQEPAGGSVTQIRDARGNEVPSWRLPGTEVDEYGTKRAAR